VAGAKRVVRPRCGMVLIDHIYDRIGKYVPGSAFAESSVQYNEDFFASLEGYPQG
jgi:hypothetical protein